MRNLIIAVLVAAIVAAGAVFVVHNHSTKTSSKTSASTSNSSKPATTANEPAVNNAVLITKNNSSVGNYLADPSGNALYTYAKDTAGVSNCTGNCLTEWPAYQAKGATSNLPAGVSTINRSDNGQVQYTYNGKPLYYFKEDSSGKVTGSGADDFQVAKPAAASAQPTSATTDDSNKSGSNSAPNYAY